MFDTHETLLNDGMMLKWILVSGIVRWRGPQFTPPNLTEQRAEDFWLLLSFVATPTPVFWDCCIILPCQKFPGLGFSSPYRSSQQAPALGSALPLSKHQPTPPLGSSPRVVGWFWVQLHGPPSPLLAHPPTCPGFLSLLFCRGWGQPPNLYLS